MTDVFAFGVTGEPLQIEFAVGVVNWVFGGVADVLPATIQAVLVLLVGLVGGSLLRGSAYDAAVGLALDEKVGETPLGAAFGDRRDAVADGVATAVTYLVYGLAIVVAIGLLDVGILRELNRTLVLYLPRVLAALLIGIVGLSAGRVAYRVVGEALAGRGLGDRVSGTMLDGVVDGDALVGAAARAVEYYVYLVALFVAADVLRLSPLEELLTGAVFYAPRLLAAGAVVLVGVVVARALARAAADSEAAARTPAPTVVAEATKAVVVLVAAVVALDVAGVDTALLATALAVVVLPVGVGLAIALGLAFGYGGREYVSENIDDWA